MGILHNLLYKDTKTSVKSNNQMFFNFSLKITVFKEIKN